jgi:hypothetical protein
MRARRRGTATATATAAAATTALSMPLAALVVMVLLVPTTSVGAATVPVGADHACVVPDRPPPPVAWSELRNPLLSEPGAAVKDQALVWAAGRWHLLFSDVTGSTPQPDHQDWHIATAESSDLVHWSHPVPWSPQPGGMASPDLVRAPDGTFVATYDSPPGEHGRTQAKLYDRTSRDLVHWSAPHRLAPRLYPSPTVRMIDPALAWTGAGLMLAYKVGTTSQPQAFEIARSASGSLTGPWQVVGRPDIRIDGDTVENYELLTLGGVWHLVATSNTLDQPWLFTLGGDPGDPASWLRWQDGTELDVPAEPWNSGKGISSVGYEHANSAFLCQDGGTYYLTYAGSTDLTSFGGWGHAAIGIARSTDLVHWLAPPG